MFYIETCLNAVGQHLFIGEYMEHDSNGSSGEGKEGAKALFWVVFGLLVLVVLFGWFVMPFLNLPS